MNNKALDCTALTIAIIGAINWGLIGLFLVIFPGFPELFMPSSESVDCILLRFICMPAANQAARHRKECTASPKEPHHVL